MKPSQNFISSHWDWLVAAVGVLALAAGGVYFAMGPSEAEGGLSGTVSSKKGDPVAAAKLDDFQAALKQIDSPVRLVVPVEGKDNFLASGSRVYCEAEVDGKRCGAPIPEGLEVCPVCGQKKKDDMAKINRDTDGDGMPDEYEKKFGLDPKEASDYNADLDGDGFTNGEEFAAGTEPNNAKSHPDYLKDLVLDGDLEERFVPFTFTKVMKVPAGLRYYFFDPKKKSDYGKMGDSYTPMEGEDIGNTGFKVVGYEERHVREKIKGGGGGEKTVDRSVAKVVRKSDGKQIAMLVEQKKTPLDVRAHLTFNRGKTEEFTVTIGDTISLYAEKYTVKDVSRKEKGAQVELVSKDNGKSFTVKSLEK